MSQQVTARYGMVPLAMRDHTSCSASGGSTRGLLRAEVESVDGSLGQPNGQAMPSDVLDKLLVIYFTHVHVSVLQHL